MELMMRRAGPSDAAPLVDLVQRAYRGEASRRGWSSEADLLDGQRVDAHMMRATLADDDASVLVAERAGVIVGCCELRPAGDAGVVAFGMFAVEPTAQNGGLGRRILTEAEQWAAERMEATTMRLTVIDLRHELIAWYERRGYARTGQTEPFPYGDERFGLPRRADLRFCVLTKDLQDDLRDPRPSPRSGS